MLRRLLPTLIALGCGLLALGWGLVSLQRIFTQEREDARAQLRVRRDTVEEYAAEALRRTLAQRLEEKRPAIHAAMGDPLARDEDFLLEFRGHPFLPRYTIPMPGLETPALRRYEQLAEYIPTGPPSGFWQERLARLRAAEAAVSSRNPSLINARVEELLRDFSAHRLAPSEELPYLLLCLERLQRGNATPPLIRAMLREGLPEDLGGVARSGGLQRDLLRYRNQLTEPDFTFLLQRVAAVSAALGAPTDDFLARAQDIGTGALVLPANLNSPTLLGQRWYIEPHPEEEVVVGLGVDLDALLKTLSADMRERNFLTKEERMGMSPGTLVPASALRPQLHSPQWEKAENAIEQRYSLKTVLVAICGGLAVAIVALAWVAQHRKYRFVELKSDFVATISHELRTPVATIRVLAETLERKFGDTPEARDYFNRILQTTDGLNFLVENILSFNRIDKGRWAPRRTRVRMDELLASLPNDLHGATEVPIRLQVDVEDVELDADPTLIRLLFSNLGRNACVYNQRTPVELTIRAYAQPGGECTVLFGDNGIGIPDSEWERVFQEFYRLTPEGTEVHGSGLGLALCRRITHLHGGTMRIVASSPVGTTFALTFPPPR